MGWRLVRTKDFDELRDALKTERALTATLQTHLREMERTAGDLKADARAAQATRDQVLIRLNQLEAEQAQVRSREKGIKAVAPLQVTSNQPAIPSGGTVSFEDVGDERAAELKAAGLLHDVDENDGVGGMDALEARVPL